MYCRAKHKPDTLQKPKPSLVSHFWLLILHLELPRRVFIAQMLFYKLRRLNAGVFSYQFNLNVQHFFVYIVLILVFEPRGCRILQKQPTCNCKNAKCTISIQPFLSSLNNQHDHYQHDFFFGKVMLLWGTSLSHCSRCIALHYVLPPKRALILILSM